MSFQADELQASHYIRQTEKNHSQGSIIDVCCVHMPTFISECMIVDIPTLLCI